MYVCMYVCMYVSLSLSIYIYIYIAPHDMRHSHADVPKGASALGNVASQFLFPFLFC